jgi:hypothetical protein
MPSLLARTNNLNRPRHVEAPGCQHRRQLALRVRSERGLPKLGVRDAERGRVERGPPVAITVGRELKIPPGASHPTAMRPMPFQVSSQRCRSRSSGSVAGNWRKASAARRRRPLASSLITPGAYGNRVASAKGA